MRKYPPIYSIRIETPHGALGSFTHTGPLAPMIPGLIEKDAVLRERVEAADARAYLFNKKPRGVDPLPDDNGGL